jgi:anti-sigma factor RsiW
VTTPDWGHDHLSSDAIVAFVDDELAPGPHLRATQHLAQCPECAAQVVAQGQARAALRTADCPSLPSSLLSSLRSIPQDTDLPPPPAGLAVTAEGQFVSVLRPERVAAGRDDSRAPQGHRSHRRMWLGTGVAVTGLAAGAIAFAVPAAVSGSAVPAPGDADTVPRPVLGGSATPVDARLQLTPQPAAATSVAPTSAPPVEVHRPR